MGTVGKSSLSLADPGKRRAVGSFKVVVTIVLRWRGMGGPGEWAVDVKDVTPLVGEAGNAKCSRSKFFLWFVSILSVCLLLVGTGYWFYWKDVVGLRVMSLNTWGIPHTFGSYDKEERMAAIGSLIADGDYDLVMLEELWSGCCLQIPHPSDQLHQVHSARQLWLNV